MNMGRLLQETLATYVDMARPILVQVAKERSTITYGGLMRRMGGCPGRAYIGEVLGRIAEIEREAGRPKLTAVVVRWDTDMVGGGFFGLPDTPSNLLRRNPEEWQDNWLDDADRAYWEQQLNALYQYWQSRNP